MKREINAGDSASGKREIQAGDAVLLNEAIIKRYKSKLVKYGDKDELLCVVSRSGDALILKGTKENFSVNIRQVR
jgi:hypothetical protein